jgi:3-dehydroquinate synthase
LHPVIFSERPNQEVFESLSQYTKVAVLVDENTKKLCYPKISEALPHHSLIEIVSGESNKTLATCTKIWQALTDMGMDRKGVLLNLGGGVIGDMGGFCASTYKRGISFFQSPTTLLSQVDASVGGKLGIDFNGLKNHIGVFAEPEAVLVYQSFLETLPEKELRSGLAEILKHGLIADRQHWDLAKNVNYKAVNIDLIEASVEIKKKVVTQDPKEGGIRKILNFGHTIGHAIETHFLEIPGERLLHGEAIAVGMICEAYLSHKLTGMHKNSLEEITDVLKNIYKPKAIEPELFDHFLTLMGHDKKNEAGKVKFSLLKNIGECTYNIEADESLVKESLHYFNEEVAVQ